MKKKMDDFIANVIIEHHLRIERAKNREVDMLEKKLFLMSRDVEEKLKLLSKEQVKFLEEYSDTRYEIEGINYLHLYKMGMKDCIKLLKYLQIL